jgi:hypothetical protein
MAKKKKKKLRALNSMRQVSQSGAVQHDTAAQATSSSLASKAPPAPSVSPEQIAATQAQLNQPAEFQKVTNPALPTLAADFADISVRATPNGVIVGVMIRFYSMMPEARFIELTRIYGHPEMLIGLVNLICAGLQYYPIKPEAKADSPTPPNS